MDSEARSLERIAVALERLAARPVIIDRRLTPEQAEAIREHHPHLHFLFTNTRAEEEPAGQYIIGGIR